MKILFLLLLPLLLIGCSAAGRSNVRTALEAALTLQQIACVFSSALTDAPALAKACEVADDLAPVLTPVIRNLIEQREGARRAGVSWRPLTDAGVQDGAP